MVRLAALSATEQEHMLKKVPDLPRFPGRPWATGPAISRRRVAIVTTAGVHLRGDQPFTPRTAGADYRVIPGDVEPGDLVMSHLSVNYDRSGFQRDWNVVFPLERLRELVAEGVVGAVAAFHYAFMGAVSPVTRYEPRARELAAYLKRDAVDAVVLSPV